MRVTNINGTSLNKCSCGSWLDHWVKFSRQPLPSYCTQTICLQKPEVGAHVQKAGSTDQSWYIVPLCKAHNGKTGESIDILDSTVFVSANVQKTCGAAKAFRAW